MISLSGTKIAPKMKVETAVIRLVLRKNKTLANGQHPIMLRVSFGGMKEKSTGYSCKERDWDCKNECLKRSYPNAVTINAHLQQMKQELIERRTELELQGYPYNAADVLQVKKSVSITTDWESVIKAYVSENALAYKSQLNYNTLFHLLQGFTGQKNPSVVGVNVAFANRFAQWLKVGRKDGVVRNILSRFMAVAHFAMRRKLIEPFEFNYTKRYKPCKKMDYIHQQTMNVLMDMFFNNLIEEKGNGWSYKGDALEALGDKHSYLFAKAFYVLGYVFHGLAPVDLALLQKKDIEIKQINGDVYYCIDTKREKTGVPVKVRVKKTRRTLALIGGLLMIVRGKWFLPVFEGLPDNATEQQMKSRLGNTMTFLTIKLKKWFREVNTRVFEMNAVTGSDIPKIDSDCTYYSYRHSFAMNYLAKGGSPLALATLLGRSPNTLSQYIKELTEEQDLVDAVAEIEI